MKIGVERFHAERNSNQETVTELRRWAQEKSCAGLSGAERRLGIGVAVKRHRLKPVLRGELTGGGKRARCIVPLRRKIFTIKNEFDEESRMNSARLRAEEDGFALEHFDSERQSNGGVDAGGRKDDGDEIPMIGASDEFFAEQTDTENGDKREFGIQLNAGKHGGDGGDDDDKHERHDVALGFLVAFCESRNGDQSGREKNRQGQCHDENREGGHESNMKGRAGVGAIGGRLKMIGNGKGYAHGNYGERCRG